MFVLIFSLHLLAASVPHCTGRFGIFKFIDFDISTFNMYLSKYIVKVMNLKISKHLQFETEGVVYFLPVQSSLWAADFCLPSLITSPFTSSASSCLAGEVFSSS